MSAATRVRVPGIDEYCATPRPGARWGTRETGNRHPGMIRALTAPRRIKSGRS